MMYVCLVVMSDSRPNTMMNSRFQILARMNSVSAVGSQKIDTITIVLNRQWLVCKFFEET